MWGFFLRRWQFKMAVLVLTIFAIIFDHHHELDEKGTLALIFVVVVLLVEQAYEQEQFLRKMRDELARTIQIQVNEVELEKAIALHEGPIGQAIYPLLAELRATLTATKDGFTVKNHNYALSSYLDFWRGLVAEQTARKKGGQPGLTAKVLHSCSIRIWNERSFHEVFLVQKEFVKAGGCIFRILCGHGAHPSPEYLAVARKMMTVGIGVFYYDMDKGELGHNFSWDFLLVEPFERAVIWKSDSNDQIREAVYTTQPEHEGEELAIVWTRIRDHANDLSSTFEI